MTTETQQIQSDPQDAATGTISAVDPPPSSEAATPAPRRKRFARLRESLRAGAGVWIGLFLIAGGFGLIAYTWGEVAGLLDVALQLPFLVSGGLTALGLILLGLLVVNIAVKRKDALERQRQLDEVREALVRLREAVEGDVEDEG